ncbi:hypothetical protein ACNY67_06830 [Pantoea sp. KXB45]|uniref:hypothetical protein n=1 Tax=Pantoea sp. KXB45 TaxID=3402309 RepID=UPI003AB79CBF
MLKSSLGFALVLFSISSHADCWVVGNLHGMAASKSNSYRFSEDAFSGQTFQIHAEKDHSTVLGSDLNFIGLNRKSVIGTYFEDPRRSVETWNISDDGKRVFYTMTRTGFSDDLDGTKSFVGDVLGKC